jgi:hypothetical protein
MSLMHVIAVLLVVCVVRFRHPRPFRRCAGAEVLDDGLQRVQ